MYKLIIGKNELTLEEKIQLFNEVNSYNGKFDDLRFYNNDEEFFQMFFSSNLLEIARAITYGEYNYIDNYVRFNAYGNLESFSDYTLEEEIDEQLDEIIDEYIELLEAEEIEDYYNLFINE